MANKTSATMAWALEQVFDGKMSAYEASKLYHLNKSSIYRNPIYKQWNGGDVEGARQSLKGLLRPAVLRTKSAGAH